MFAAAMAPLNDGKLCDITLMLSKLSELRQ
jgi:hypothetical protein